MGLQGLGRGGAKDMDESSGDRYELEGARVFIHVSEHEGEPLFHIDIDHPDLNKIILPKEASYVGGRDGGIFVGLRPTQADRAQSYVKDLSSQ